MPESESKTFQSSTY